MKLIKKILISILTTSILLLIFHLFNMELNTFFVGMMWGITFISTANIYDTWYKWRIEQRKIRDEELRKWDDSIGIAYYPDFMVNGRTQLTSEEIKKIYK